MSQENRNSELNNLYQAIDDNNTGTNGQYYFEQNLKFVFYFYKF